MTDIYRALVSLFSLFSTLAFARDLYVAVSGDSQCIVDGQTCGSPGNPISLQHAMNNVIPGDVVHVNPGTYRTAFEPPPVPTNGYSLDNKGSSSAPQIQFIGATDADPAARIIDGSGSTYLPPDRGLLNTYQSQNILIHGFTVTVSSGRGISVSLGSNVTITKCYISQTWDQGVLLTGVDHTFQNNEVDNAYARNYLGRCESPPCPAECGGLPPQGFCGVPGSGVNTWGINTAPYYSTGISFRDNHIHHIWGECLQLYGSAWGWISNNTIHDCRSVNVYLNNVRYYNVLNNYIYNGLDTGTDCNVVPTAPQCFYSHIPRQPADGILIAKQEDDADPPHPRYPDPLHNLNFYNNVIDNNRYGFDFWSNRDDNPIPGNTYDNIIISNNVIRGSSSSPIQIDPVGASSSTPSYSKLENNIIYGTSVVFGNPNAWSPSGTGSVNNNLFVNAAGTLPIGLPPNEPANNFAYTDARLCRNDSLVSGSPSVYSYFIQPGSRAIGIGIYEPVAPEDYDWVTRTSPINAGINQVPRTVNCQP